MKTKNLKFQTKSIYKRQPYLQPPLPFTQYITSHTSCMTHTKYLHISLRAHYSLFIYPGASFQRKALYSPEVDAGPALIDIGRLHLANSAFTEEGPDKGRVLHFRPVLDREIQRIGVVIRRVAELQIAVHRDLIMRHVKRLMVVLVLLRL